MMLSRNSLPKALPEPLTDVVPAYLKVETTEVITTIVSRLNVVISMWDVRNV